ncbi:MAG: HAD hydrolase family protein [Rikenellaceae bacterium]|nr:HAD hydrolase family protein [Rikenellaceae bacterium]MCL2692942.1 HAD hydrolase family protein [Rikenellaceae bacterium]
MGNFKEDIAQVEAFVFDVDGVFTDGHIGVLPAGDFLRQYNVKDGFAVMYALRAGYKVAIITGGYGEALEMRFRQLKVTAFHHSCRDKLSRLREFMSEHALRPEQVLYMGDDLPDLECLRHVGMPVAPADAVPEVLNASRYVSQFGGGEGCVRDIIEQVLRARGDWAQGDLGLTSAPQN